MAHLNDRIHYELPLNHSNFESVRLHCINTGNESIDNYRHSQDSLLIQVKCYSTCTNCLAKDLNLVDNNDINWIYLLITVHG